MMLSALQINNDHNDLGLGLEEPQIQNSLGLNQKVLTLEQC